MASRFVDFEIRDRVAYVTLSRPEKLNAISRQMFTRLVEIFTQVRVDDSIWVVLVRAEGERAFSVGGDLREKALHDDERERPHQPGLRVERNPFEAVLHCSKPVVAAVNGMALGGGCELALASDIRLASESATIGMPEAKWGQGGNFGALMLREHLPPGVAYEMLYTARILTAAEAERWGLFNRIVPDSELFEAAEVYVRSLLQFAPLTQRRHKQIITHGRQLPFSTLMQLSPEPNPYTSSDRVEGTRAFAEGRSPVWTAE